MAIRHVFTLGAICGICALAGCGQGSTAKVTDQQPRARMPERMVLHSEVMTSPLAPAFQMPNEAYERLPENRLIAVKDQPLSTFSIDVDTASYSNVRRFLQQRVLPPAEAVRIEQMINYFSYHDSPPDGDTPFSVNVEVAGCPWNQNHRLARIGLKGKTIEASQRPAGNIVFLIDVSGSMNAANKLPLVKQSLKLLAEQLGESDHISIVVYAGAAGLVLPPTSASNKDRILDAIERLQSGGSTNGAIGIGLAYDVARQNYIPGGVNRVVLCTDGDFNVGVTSPEQLQELITNQAKSGVFLTVLGFGMGNLKDATMERLADHGNGNYGYIDNFSEAKKLFVEQLSGTLVTIAKDVKIQVEFNPVQVAAYRLIGYENRRMANRDFHDDTKDAGEIGAGHSVMALYELVPAGSSDVAGSPIDRLRYQQSAPENTATRTANATSDEMFAVRVRFKAPDGQQSRLIEVPVVDRGTDCRAASADFRFAASVVQFGMLLTNSAYLGNTTYDQILEVASGAIGDDPHAHRKEFLELVTAARELTAEQRMLSKRD